MKLNDIDGEIRFEKRTSDGRSAKIIASKGRVLGLIDQRKGQVKQVCDELGVRYLKEGEK